MSGGKAVGEKAEKQAGLDYVVGAEKKIGDLLSGAEVMPLLEGVVKAGASGAAVRDLFGRELWACGLSVREGDDTEEAAVCLEGEEVGRVSVAAGGRDRASLSGLAGLLAVTVQTMMHTNLKRMLTTETHTAVVNRSYEELLQTNRSLAASEARYRELAENLEKKVLERTEDLKRTYARLLQREKMASVGQLAAGVAHEINNPLGFIVSNLHTLRKYVARYEEMLEYYRTSFEEGGAGARARELSRGKWRQLKLDVITGDTGELIGQCLHGAERVRKIVSDLKGFSHIEEVGEIPVELHNEIDRTLSVLAHEIPGDAEIIRDYRPLPAFVCNPALLCQVFLNIVLNALQARPAGLRLAVSTDLAEDRLRIIFSDNGPGIPAEIADRIFEPFFTTKDVGKGTGMGLTVAYDVITGYGGTIEVKSKPGQGAAFIVELPARRGEHVKVF
jgi:two-component system NtrC family sensor kinase